MRAVLLLLVALLGASLAQVDVIAALDQIEAELQALPTGVAALPSVVAEPDATAVAPDLGTAGVSTQFSTSPDLQVDQTTELDSLPPLPDGQPADQTRSTTVGGATYDVGTLVGITCGVFFAGLLVFLVVLARYRRNNLIDDIKLNAGGGSNPINDATKSGGVREFHLPWQRHQLVVLSTIAVLTVLLTVAAALAYYFAATAGSNGFSNSAIGTRALLMTPSNGPAPAWDAPCSGSGNSAPCIAAWLALVNKARARERVKPMVLPANYARLSVPNQNEVLVNLERQDRGLPRFATPLVPQYDSMALTGARHHTDPMGPSGHSWGGNWCSSSNALMCNYLYMYWDGPGGSNADCRRPSDPGCWGHRKNILRKWTTTRLHMGSAVSGQSSTQLFVAG